MILGAGAGWYKPEFEGFSRWYENRERVTITREGIELMIKLWTENEPVNYNGKYLTSTGGLIEPKPVQKPHPPIWFGALSERMLRVCGRYGDGWLPIGPRWIGDQYPRPEKYAEMRKIIVTELKKRGYPEDKFTFSCLINVADSKILLNDIESYLKAGMNYFTLGLQREKDDSIIAKMDQISKELDTLALVSMGERKKSASTR